MGGADKSTGHGFVPEVMVLCISGTRVLVHGAPVLNVEGFPGQSHCGQQLPIPAPSCCAARPAAAVLCTEPARQASGRCYSLSGVDRLLAAHLFVYSVFNAFLGGVVGSAIVQVWGQEGRRSGAGVSAGLLLWCGIHAVHLPIPSLLLYLLQAETSWNRYP